MMLLTNFSRQMFSLSAPTQPANPKVNITIPTTKTSTTGSRPWRPVTFVRSDNTPWKKKPEQNVTTVSMLFTQHSFWVISTWFQMNWLHTLELANSDTNKKKVLLQNGHWQHQFSSPQRGNIEVTASNSFNKSLSQTTSSYVYLPNRIPQDGAKSSVLSLNVHLVSR